MKKLIYGGLFLALIGIVKGSTVRKPTLLLNSLENENRLVESNDINKIEIGTTKGRLSGGLFFGF